MAKNLMNKSKVIAVQTLIAENVTVGGEITSPGAIKVDGIVNGGILSESNVVLGEKSKIIGNVKGTNIIISGYVQGDVLASGQISLTSTANVDGDMIYSGIIIDEGAKFSGSCTMNKPLKVETQSQEQTAEDSSENDTNDDIYGEINQ